MNTKSPLKNWVRMWLSLSIVAILGVGPIVTGPTEQPAIPGATWLLVDGQETHGKNGGRRSLFRVADGQETHGKNGGRRSA